MTQPVYDYSLEETCPPALPNPPRIIAGDTARMAAVAKFRELADRLESGELDGARIQWRDGLHHVETVELDGRHVALLRFELYSPERPHNYDGDVAVEQILSQLEIPNGS